ncbi:MAG: AMP-binding protein [Nevskia sp.]|nr:AMP-binding protein [Nevskia sp.]
MEEVAAELLPLQRIYHWEKARADKPFLTQPMGGGVVRDWTWAQAVDEARRIAAFLKAQAWEPGSRIAILSKNCAHWIMADFAIWMAGHVSVPLYPTLTAESVRQILEHSGAVALFVGKLDTWETMKPGVPAGVLRIAMPLAPPDEGATGWERIVADTAPLAGAPVRAGAELATIVYTSGTTGMPKGVMHSFNTIGWSAGPSVSLYGLGEEDRMLSYLPLAHVAERWVVEANAIRSGFHIFFAETQDSFLQDLRRARPTFFISVPRLWVKFQQGVFARMPKEKLDRLFRIPLLGRLAKKKILRQLGLDTVRFAGGGAAPMPAALLHWYRGLGLELLEGYGMTENFGCSHGSRVGAARVGYVGQPYPGVEQKIAPDGEVLVRSPTNMMGYFKEPEKTRETLEPDGWLHTGDRGELDEQGRLRITGRVKEIFKTAKGKYVAPSPIESRLNAHPKVEAVCVAGASHPQPFAIAILAPDAAAAFDDPALRAELNVSLEEILRKTNEAIDPHEHLDFIVVVREQWNVDNGFITPTLKIKRNAVESAYGRYFDEWRAQRQVVVWHPA